MDTGCTNCIIKLSSIVKTSSIEKIQSQIQGVGGFLEVVGIIKVLFLGKYLNFRIVKDLPIDVDGFLGADFFKIFKAHLNFESNTITIKANFHKSVTFSMNRQEQCNFGNSENEQLEKKIVFPMYTKNNSSFTIPKRCELIKKISTQAQEDCVLRKQEIADGVFIAETLVRPKNGEIQVKILNTREQDVTINNFKPILESLEDFELCALGTTKIDVERVKKLLENLNLNTLNSEEIDSITAICSKYADVFHMDGDPYTHTNLYEQTIKLKPEATPVYRKPYRIPQSQKSEIDKQVKEMLKQKIIEPAASEWSSPILLVPKKADSAGNKRWRLVIDYRRLNENIEDEKFPLANITDILDSLAGAIYFTTLDLSQGFYQLPIKKDDRGCTAFVTDKGQYQMCKLPMGLKISPSAFSRMMTVALAGLNYENCFVYLDDIIVFGKNLEQHNKNLMTVLTRLRKVNLKLNPAKCVFARKSVLYLGHLISDKGIQPDPDKLTAIKNFPVPKNADESKRFVAFANYYRKFVKNFSIIAAPLNKLQKKGAIFEWTPKCQEAFEIIIRSLSNPEILDYPDFSNNNIFVLTTDASRVGLGAVLSNSNGRPVAFASRTLNKAESNYSTTEIELLAVVWAVKHFRPYLFGRYFEIKSDHRALVYLFAQADPSSRLTKFRMTLLEYNFSIIYVKGKNNVVADALSRINIEELQELTKRVDNSKIMVLTRAQTKKLKAEPKKDSPQAVESDQLDAPIVSEVLRKGTNMIELKEIKITRNQKEVKMTYIEKECVKYAKQNKKQIVYCEKNKTLYLIRSETNASDDLRSPMQALIEVCTRLGIADLAIAKKEENRELIQEIKEAREELKREEIRIFIVPGVEIVQDEETKKLILNDYHMLPTGGHAGCNRMYKNMKKLYLWSGMDKDVQQYVKRCDSCQRFKHSLLPKEEMIITSTATEALDKIYLDLVGPIMSDEDEFRYILTIQCELSKYILAIPLKNKESTTVARAFVDHFILKYGIPSAIATDCGTEFMSETFTKVCQLLNINKLNSTAYHHESIGALENSHKHLGAFLRIQLNAHGGTWSNWVNYWTFTYNTTVHTETNYTPYELVFGKSCNLPSNLAYPKEVDPLYNPDNYPLELKFRLQSAAKEAHENLITSKIARKNRNDRFMRPLEIVIGDQVLVKKENRAGKLDVIFVGPFEVTAIEEPNIKIKIKNKEQLIHKNRVKKYNT